MEPEIMLFLTQLMEMGVEVDDAGECEQPPAVAEDGADVMAKDTFFAGGPENTEVNDREAILPAHVDESDGAADGQAAAMLMYYHLVGCGVTDKRNERDRRQEEDDDQENDKDEANNS